MLKNILINLNPILSSHHNKIQLSRWWLQTEDNKKLSSYNFRICNEDNRDEKRKMKGKVSFLYFIIIFQKSLSSSDHNKTPTNLNFNVSLDLL